MFVGIVAVGLFAFLRFDHATENFMRNHPQFEFTPDAITYLKREDHALAREWLIGCLIAAPVVSVLCGYGVGGIERPCDFILVSDVSR